MDTSSLFQDCYTGTDFENKIVEFLSKYGFMAQKTGSNDGGIDIVATSDTVPSCMWGNGILFSVWFIANGTEYTVEGISLNGVRVK